MGNVISIIITLNYVLTFIFILFNLFIERKAPSHRFAWILVLSFLPFLGVFLYLLLSGHFFTKTRKMWYITTNSKNISLPYLEIEKKMLSELEGKSLDNPLNNYLQIINMNLQEGKSLLTSTETVKIFSWGQDMFNALWEDLEKAETYINMEYFIWHNDNIGKKTLDILCQKAKAGVKVKVLYDDMGSLRTPRKFFQPLKKAGGKVYPFFNIKRGFAFTINFRNHRKITVIDDKIGYSGGTNIGDEYANCSTTKKWKNVVWRDTHFRFTGPSVMELQRIFLIDWYGVSGKFNKNNLSNSKYIEKLENYGEIISKEICPQFCKNYNPEKNIPTQIVTSGPDDFENAEIRDMIIRMILSAKKRVCIESPYFTPDETFISVLKIAAQSGIKIDIIVPGFWDKWYVKEAAFDFIRECINNGIKFYSYNGFIHSKMVIIDDEIVTIGTTNIDTRSFELHYEVNTIFYHQQLAKECGTIFQKDIENSTQLSEKDFIKYNPIRRAWWRFFRLFSPLL